MSTFLCSFDEKKGKDWKKTEEGQRHKGKNNNNSTNFINIKKKKSKGKEIVYNFPWIHSEIAWFLWTYRLLDVCTILFAANSIFFNSVEWCATINSCLQQQKQKMSSI